jgi:hypothetical protein
MAKSANEFVAAKKKVWKQDKEEYGRGLARYITEEKKIKKMRQID